ncbi:MAG: type II secretion system F family protein [Gammaproteobacteria bacterium]|nr:type II secretion system F family protein [Gammaproteobacteria bacterium]MDX2459306.1 type II secretion system F family protein [Gammaproteobacteria bacterium]
MPLMQYKAMDERGKVANGRMEAVNEADLETRLRRMGLDLINFTAAKTKSTGVARKVPRREIISFCLQLEQLISSGVPLLEGLQDLRDSCDDRKLRDIVAGMVEFIEGGSTLSASMEHYPQIFDNVFVNLVRAGEFSGQMSIVLKTLTENLKWQDEQAAQMKKLLMYPLFVGTVVMLVVIFLMTYLVPQLTSFIVMMGQELPLHTRILIGLSDFMVGYWYVVMGLPAILFIIFMAVLGSSSALQYTVDDLKLKVWLLGPIYKKMLLSRFANYFALMYRSGITVLECIRICEGLVGNKAIEAAAHRAGRQIGDGASISAGFEYTGLFPPLVLRMLRVGESTGGLDDALLNISYFYNRDVSESIEKVQALIGPAMTVVLGAILGWVIVSVLGPIYDMITQVNI